MINIFRKTKYIILFILLAFIVGFFLAITKNHIILTLNEPKYEISVFDYYQEPGVICKEGNILTGYKKCTASAEGNVNTAKVGTYHITYKYKNKNITKTVYVKDNIKPEIIIDEKSLITCPNTTPKPIYSSQDNYDGEITNKVKTQILNDEINFTINDSSNNTTTVTKKIIYQDTEKPTITLKGDNPMYILKNETYKEPGYTVRDNCDTINQKQVTISNNIDNTKTGSYQVTYTVKDNNNNKTSITRKVNVINTNTNTSIQPKQKTIYLTFDDGPGQYTDKLLGILEKYNVKATFFVTNQFPKYQKLIKKIDNNGHSVALHTYSHQWSIYTNKNTYFNDLNKISNIVKSQTGKEVHLIRFPGGSGNTVSYKYNKGIMTSLTKEVEKRGYKYFDWNIDCGDTRTKNANTVSNNVINSLKKNPNRLVNIVLMHDIKKHSVEAISKIIGYGLANGYTFAKLEENSPTIKGTVRN